jgi:hypothetical protein
VTHRRSWAALAVVWGGVALAGASSAGHPAPAPARQDADAGAASTARPTDAGRPGPAPARDGGSRAAAPLGDEDLEVVQNLDLLEHFPESDFLDLLLLSPDGSGPSP